MRDFIITSDTTCDLPQDYCAAHSIDIHPLYYRFGDEEIYGGDNSLDPAVFYSRMRGGEMPTTMATNPEDSKELFQSRISQGYDILHIAFSSALSSSCQNAALAAAELMDENPEASIRVVDSLCASMGEGLLVYKAIEYKQAGHTLEETIQYVESIKLKISHQFTVDDLFHLHRGGRVSKATAIVGTIVGIKPLLHVNDLGELKSIGKTRGRKKSLVALVDKMAATMDHGSNETIMISHGDCLEDAQFVADRIKSQLPEVHNVLINLVCPTIGAHSGPGTIALFFEGSPR